MAEELHAGESVPLESDVEEEEAPSPRRRIGRRITREMAEIIQNVSSACEEEKKANFRFHLGQAVRRTAYFTGVSQREISKIRTTPLDKYPLASEREERNRGTITPDHLELQVRQVLAELYSRGVMPTMDILHHNVCHPSDDVFPPFPWGRTTLYYMLQGLGVTFGKGEDQYTAAKTKPWNITQRIMFIRAVRQHRLAGRRIFYHDESWLNLHMTQANVWRNPDGQGGIIMPSGRGGRIVMTHLGSSATGFLNGGGVLAKGYTDAEDYHTEFNGPSFMHYLEHHALANMRAGDVLVLDRAPYHTLLTPETQPPKSSMLKAEVYQYIQRHTGAPDDELLGLTKAELLEIARQHAPEPVFAAVKLAESKGIIVEFLPVGHPELNPIELMWNRVKAYVRKNNRDHTEQHVIGLAWSIIDQLDADQWALAEQHCVNFEDMWMSTADSETFCDF